MTKTQSTKADSPYAEQLKDQRWKDKRKSIIEQDGNKCRRCQSKKKPLHVHHLRYKRGNMAWEYADANLVTLCDECHEYLHHLKTNLNDETDRHLESWVTNINRERFDAEDLWQFLLQLNFVKKETLKKYFEVFGKIFSLEFWNNQTEGE